MQKISAACSDPEVVLELFATAHAVVWSVQDQVAETETSSTMPRSMIRRVLDYLLEPDALYLKVASTPTQLTLNRPSEHGLHLEVFDPTWKSTVQQIGVTAKGVDAVIAFLQSLLPVERTVASPVFGL